MAKPLISLFFKIIEYVNHDHLKLTNSRGILSIGSVDLRTLFHV